MKKIFRKYVYQKKVLITIGVVVSLIVLHQNNIYSSPELQKLTPQFEQLKENVSNHFNSETKLKSHLSNGNFIASYISIISNRVEKSEDTNCPNSSALACIKNKVVKIFSSI